MVGTERGAVLNALTPVLIGGAGSLELRGSSSWETFPLRGPKERVAPKGAAAVVTQKEWGFKSPRVGS